MKKVFFGSRGGGVKTAVAIGVLKVLEEEKIKVAEVSGASIGAIVATLEAIGTPADKSLYLLKKYVVQYSNASRPKGGKGNSSVIEETVNEQCNYMCFKDVEKPLYITANAGGLWNTKLFVFSKETTPDTTLGEACRASCSFPFAYKRYSLNIDKKMYKFYDGGMAMNPLIPDTQNVKVLATFEKTKTNTRSRYRDAKTTPEEKSDFVIKTYVGNMPTFGNPSDIQMAYDLGYCEAKRRIKELKELLE